MDAPGDPSLILPVVLAGGIGARLAPISTPARPKPFIPLADGESLLTKTYARLKHAAFAPPLVIGRAADRFSLLNHARAAGAMPQAILLESEGRNTAAAVALAACWVAARHGPAQMMAVLPADHAIGPEEAWRTTLQHAAYAAREAGALCLLTATPTRPESGFGYALLGPGSAWHLGRPVRRFIEKPADPAPFIAEGARWNMGQFMGTAGQFIEALETYAPATLQAARELLEYAQQRWEFTELGPWPTGLDAMPFDKAVLEHAESVAVAFTGQWQDLGDLTSWHSFTGLDETYYARQPVRVDRPWGYFERHQEKTNELHKLLILYPGCRLSKQRHQRRAEQWEVISGTALVELDNDIKRLEVNDKIMIPVKAWHRLSNHHSDTLIIKEIQLGICDESDIEREDDDYGRT